MPICFTHVFIYFWLRLLQHSVWVAPICAKLALRTVIILFHRWLPLLLRLKFIASIYIFSIALVWRRSDLFNVILQITGYVSLHNQRPLHTTLSKIVFTSHYVYFHYIVICPVSLAWTIGMILFVWSRCISCGLWTGHCSSYLFPALFAIQILISFMSVAHVSPVPSPLYLRCASWLWTGRCSGFILFGTVS